MSNDRKQLIRLAASRPVGDPVRRVLLGELQKHQKTSAVGSLDAVMKDWFDDLSLSMARMHSQTGSKMKVRNVGPDGFSFTLDSWTDSARNYRTNVAGQLRLTGDRLKLEFGNEKWTWDLDTPRKAIAAKWRELNSYNDHPFARSAASNKEARGWDGTLEGSKARAKWVRRGQWPYMEIEELPGKPFKRKLRKAEFRWSNHGQQWPLLMENVLEDARLSRNMDYDKMVRAMKNALKKIPGKYDEKTVARFGPMQEYVQKELDRAPYEETVFYLNVEPANYKDVSFTGRDFGGTSKWTEFTFYSDSDEYDQQEGMQAFTKSTSAGGARKLFKMLKANPDLVKNISEKDFTKMLDKNKIGYRYVPTVWR